MSLKDTYHHVKRTVSSKQGKNFAIFVLFILIAAILWCVTAINDETQADIRLPIRITNVPDSVTIVSKLPQNISIGVRARGSQLLKYSWSKPPSLDIDYRLFNNGNIIKLSENDIKNLARNTLSSSQIIVVSPDSLSIKVTTKPPVLLPVELDCHVTVGPQATLSGKPVGSPDSVKVYTYGNHILSFTSIKTEPIEFQSINESVTRKVALITPPNTRVIPDSIDVTVKVEPLIFKTRTASIEPINVPNGQRLILFPSQVNVMYLIPVSEYIDAEQNIRIVADYNSISDKTGKVKLRIDDASNDLQNIHIALDSVECIIEKLDK